MAIKRQTIVDTLKTLLETIATPTYHTNLGANVFLWRSPEKVVQANTVPAAIIRDIQDLITYDALPFDHHALTVEIELVCAAGSTSDTVIRQMIYDVYRAIGTSTTLSGNAVDTRLVLDEIMVEQKEKIIGGATITIEILYRTSNYAES